MPLASGLWVSMKNWVGLIPNQNGNPVLPGAGTHENRGSNSIFSARAEDPLTIPMEPKETVPPALAARGELPYGVYLAEVSGSYQLGGTPLTRAPIHTLISAEGFHFGNFAKVGIKKEVFDTNFVEPSEDPAENFIEKEVEYAEYSVEGNPISLGGFALSFEGKHDVAQVERMEFSPVPTPRDSIIEKQLQTIADLKIDHPGRLIKKVLGWRDFRLIFSTTNVLLFQKEQLIHYTTTDYGEAYLEPRFSFKMDGTDYYLFIQTINHSRWHRLFFKNEVGWSYVEPIQSRPN